jgi:hypothetical protein
MTSVGAVALARPAGAPIWLPCGEVTNATPGYP